MRYAGRLQSAMRMQARATDNLRSHPKDAVVSHYDPARYAIQVDFQPEGNTSGWIPLGALWAGDGWGVYAAPAIGTAVQVEFIDGNSEAGIAGLSFFNNEDQPLAVQSGEFWIVHSKGGFFKLTNDGKVAFNDGQGASVTLNGDGTMTSAATNWSHTGNVTVTGSLMASVDVVGGGISLKTHPHAVPNVQGGSTTLPTTAPT